VHYFRNFIAAMQANGHQFLVFARDKEVTHDLLNRYGIPFLSRGKGGKGLFAKLLYLLKADALMYAKARRFSPDLFVSFASPYAAQVSKLCRKPHLAVDDTEHATFEILLYKPFTDKILTPFCFLSDYGKKQERISAYAEFLYLHRNRFHPRPVDKELGLMPGEKFALLRFISWTASHDLGQKGIPAAEKKALIEELHHRGYKVFISAEGALPADMEKFRLPLASNRIHDVLAAASLFVGESGTMSTEACILGTPAFFVNTLDAGVFRDEVNRGLLVHIRDGNSLCRQIFPVIDNPGFYEKFQEAVEALHRDSADFTDILEKQSLTFARR